MSLWKKLTLCIIFHRNLHNWTMNLSHSLQKSESFFSVVCVCVPKMECWKEGHSVGTNSINMNLQMKWKIERFSSIFRVFLWFNRNWIKVVSAGEKITINFEIWAIMLKTCLHTHTHTHFYFLMNRKIIYKLEWWIVSDHWVHWEFFFLLLSLNDQIHTIHYYTEKKKRSEESFVKNVILFSALLLLLLFVCKKILCIC